MIYFQVSKLKIIFFIGEDEGVRKTLRLEYETWPGITHHALPPLELLLKIKSMDYIFD